ncbi:MAG: aldehyde ferredoxin oxidoreductase family protein [Spirochaetia bacterium]
MPHGYWERILRVDLDRRTCTVEETSPGAIDMFLGGRGLAAWYYFHEIGFEVDAFSPANTLFFMTGPLTGTDLPGGTRFQLAAKSPETRMYLCSSCGGDFATRLKEAGFDGLAITGKARDWTWLSIVDDTVRFHDARGFLGFTSDLTREALRDAVGDADAGTLSIGPAAERLVRISCINVDERALGRGGGGAIMGSKHLKGVVVRGTRRCSVADPQRVGQIRESVTARLRKSAGAQELRSTLAFIEPINALGAMPTRNFQAGTFEGANGVDMFAARETARVVPRGCLRCPVGCGMSCEVRAGKYAGSRARPEYESVALLGPNCGVEDFAAVVKAHQLCDELGIDTMSAGHAVALTMELFERGLISTRDTDGIEARFGNAESLIGIIRLIAGRTAIGDVLAEGMYAVKRARPAWAPYILDVKGMPFAGYDPRGFHGNALTYGTSNRGACHNVGGWTVRAELRDEGQDRFGLSGKGALVKRLQDVRAYQDSIGICSVVCDAYGFTDHPTGDVLEAVTGHPFTPRLPAIGERVYTIERMILNREGMRRANDQLPPRIMKEALATVDGRGRTLTAEMYAAMLDEYYLLRGWDADGTVKEETIRKLGLSPGIARPRRE